MKNFITHLFVFGLIFSMGVATTWYTPVYQDYANELAALRNGHTALYYAEIEAKAIRLKAEAEAEAIRTVEAAKAERSWTRKFTVWSNNKAESVSNWYEGYMNEYQEWKSENDLEEATSGELEGTYEVPKKSWIEERTEALASFLQSHNLVGEEDEKHK
jgi:hypothetical protein